MSKTSTPVASLANGPAFVWLMYVHKWCTCPATVIAMCHNLVGRPVECTGHSS